MRKLTADHARLELNRGICLVERIHALPVMPDERMTRFAFAIGAVQFSANRKLAFDRKFFAQLDTERYQTVYRYWLAFNDHPPPQVSA